MTEVESLLIEFIETWYNEEMKLYTDKQYGKGEFKELVTKAKEMIKNRDIDEITNYDHFKKYLLEEGN